MTLTSNQICDIIATFRTPDRSQYPELDGYTCDEIYEIFLAAEDCTLPCTWYAPCICNRRYSAGPWLWKRCSIDFWRSIFGVKVVAVDLWTSATFLNQKFTAHGYRDRIVPLHLDVTEELPFVEDYFDVIFCMNSFNFYGGNIEFISRLLMNLKAGGQLCIG